MKNNITFVNILKTSEDIQEQVRLWRNSEAVRKYMINQHSISVEEHRCWLKKNDESNVVQFWVIQIDGKAIGSAYLSNIDHTSKVVEWGFYIGEESFREKGLARLILERLCEIVFDEMKFKLLKTKVLSDNCVALNFYKRFGIKYDKDFPDEPGKDIIMMVFNEEDWNRYKCNRSKYENN